MARHGVAADDAMLTVRFAIGGDNAVAVRDGGNQQVPLSIQYAPEYIDTLAKIRRSPVVTGAGRGVAIEEIADAVACTTLSLLPIMFIDGPGMEIMKPIAAPTVGGMVSSAIYVLFLIPCLFAVGQDMRRVQSTKENAG